MAITNYDRWQNEYHRSKRYEYTLKNRRGGLETSDLLAANEDEAYEQIKKIATYKGCTIHTWKQN